MLQLTCRWDGGYPDPDFLWMEEPGGVVVGMSKLGVEMLNQSQLLDGKKFRCVGSHIVGPESGASCVVQIGESDLPYPGVGVHLPSFLLGETFERRSGKEIPGCQSELNSFRFFLSFALCFLPFKLKILNQASWSQSELFFI